MPNYVDIHDENGEVIGKRANDPHPTLGQPEPRLRDKLAGDPLLSINPSVATPKDVYALLLKITENL